MIFDYQFWIIIGVLLCILEVLSGFFISLTFGITALCMALLLFISPHIFPNWYILLAFYCAASFTSSYFIWKKYSSKEKEQIDIND